MRTVLVLLAIVSRGLWAEEIWQEWKAEGSGCNERNVEFLASGQYLALIPRELSIRLDGASRNISSYVANKDCRIRVKVVPPEGQYLSGVRQTYMGGIIKGPKSYAKLHILYKLGNLQDHKDREWKYGTAIAPESPQSLWTQVIESTAKKTKCKEKMQLNLEIRMTVLRQPKDEAVIMALDSVDIEMNPSLYLQPVFKPCPR